MALATLCLGCRRGGEHADGQRNILLNGDLTKGTSNSPDYWESAAWQARTAVFGWNHTAGAPGELEVSSDQPNDAHWSQTVHLARGWYHFSASMRAEGVPHPNAGAYLSVMEDGIISRMIYGSTSWQPVEFYLKVGAAGADVAVACRLGGFSSPNTGKAFCRNLTVARVLGPADNSFSNYDLDRIRGISASPQSIVTPLPDFSRLPLESGDKHASKSTKLLETVLDVIDTGMALIILGATLLMIGLSGGLTYVANVCKGLPESAVTGVSKLTETPELVADAVLSLAIVLATVEILKLTGTWELTYGSHIAGWFYYYYGTLRARTILIGVVIAAAMIALLRGTLRFIDAHQFLVLLVWFVSGTLVQVALHSCYPQGLGQLVTSEANSYWRISGEHGALDVLMNWRALVPNMPLHVQSNMPGKVFLYNGLRLLTTAPMIMAIIVLALSNLGGILLYFIAHKLYHNRCMALLAFALYLFIPAKIYFMPLLNIVSAVPMLAAILVTLAYGENPKPRLARMLGVLLYGVTLFDPLTLSLGIFLIVPLHALKRDQVESLIVQSVLAFVVCDVAMRLVFHFDIIAALQTVVVGAHRFNMAWTPPRYYLPWLLPNTFELFLSAGVGISLAFFAFMFLGRRKMPDTLIFGEAIATIGIMVLSGINRGEVVRLWIYMMPFIALVAASVLVEYPWSRDVALVSIITQAAATISVVTFIG